MEATEYELIVTQGKRPFWKTLLAAVLFTATFYFLYRFVLTCWYLDVEKNNPKSVSGLLELIGFCLTGGLYFSLVKTVLIDVDQDKLVSRFSIGPFSKRVHTNVPELEYVAVFLNAKDQYEVNLWYKGNKHYKMYLFEEKRRAFQFAEMVSQKLKLDILDATERGNSKWIEFLQSN